jgi:HEPN domain-containing protein
VNNLNRENKLNDVTKIINIANSFVLAADICMKMRGLGENLFQILPIPAVVCRAFGIELYFKAILTHEGNNKKGHKLSELFSFLSPESQATLKGNFAIDGDCFTQKLGEISDSFVTWRYIYESSNEHLDLDFLTALGQACKILAESKIDELKNK